jgi:hypothetical protein
MSNINFSPSVERLKHANGAFSVITEPQMQRLESLLTADTVALRDVAKAKQLLEPLLLKMRKTDVTESPRIYACIQEWIGSAENVVATLEQRKADIEASPLGKVSNALVTPQAFFGATLAAAVLSNVNPLFGIVAMPPIMKIFYEVGRLDEQPW